jgi:hypothetical protein
VSLDSLPNLLYDFTIELALPLCSVSLGLIGDTIKNFLPLLVLEVIEPKLVLKQIDIMRLDYARNFTLTDT